MNIDSEVTEDDIINIKDDDSDYEINGNANTNNPNDNDEKNDKISKKKSNKRKQTFERKNIRNIIDEDNFCQDAKEAQKAEVERLKRVQEKTHLNTMRNLLNSNLRFGPKQSNLPIRTFQDKPFIPKITLPSFQSATSFGNNGLRFKKAANISKMYRVITDESLTKLEVSDDEDDLDSDIREFKEEKAIEVIEISDGEEGDDDIDEVVDQEKLDIKNFLRDEYGRIIINDAHPSDEEDYFLCDKISYHIKPHQVSGVRFLYNNLVESKKQFKESDGFGCILAHSMGLGKTIQVIGFLDVIFRCVEARSALVIVPINTLQNWQAEMDHWLPDSAKTSAENDPVESVGNECSDKKHSNNRPFNLFVIKENHKTIESRHAVIKDWINKGGVLLIGYEMFRLLVTYRKNILGVRKKKKEKDKIPKKKVCIDIELEEKRDNIYQDFLKALIDPGPEIVICDEGHRIKNSEASISKALKSIKTHRRVVMTGYPLQNNLTEYWCMVDFVRPNYLGTKHEFNNMFQRPIENGQCVDSTYEDRKLMQGRAHVLHELLQGFVQRRSHAVLKANLPPKWEYVIVVKMSHIQRKLYSTFMDQVIHGGPYMWAQNNILKTYAMCCKIWNHPDILYKLFKEKKEDMTEPDFDFDIEDDFNGDNSSKTSSKISVAQKSAGRKRTKSNQMQPISNGNNSGNNNLNINKNTPSPSTTGATETVDGSQVDENDQFSECSSKQNSDVNTNFQNKVNLLKVPSNASSVTPSSIMTYNEYLENVVMQRDVEVNVNSASDSFAWITEDLWKLPECPDMKNNEMKKENLEVSQTQNSDYMVECRENGGKIVVFLSLLEECLKYNDKMLVFSQSLLTLDLLEIFIKQIKLPNGSDWIKNKTYYRLDGSTSATERERMITGFNAPDSEAGLFLLSTRAGCLGINLIGANRVIVFDASWNPCHDCQAVCRVYRYGQYKPCFIYRLITDNTMEKKIYDRQVKKQGISDRVVDESNPGQQFTRSQVQVLIEYADQDIPSLSQQDIKAIQKGCGDEDPILRRVIERHSNLITKIPFTHESLLIDQKDYRLTRREKRKAKEQYEIDKRQSLYYQRNNYSDFYIKTTVPVTETSTVPKSPSVSVRSSIMPNQIHNLPAAGAGGLAFSSTDLLNTGSFPLQSHPHQQHYRLNHNFRPQMKPQRSSTALIRDLERARMRHGFQVMEPPSHPIQSQISNQSSLASLKKYLDNRNTDDIDLTAKSDSAALTTNGTKPFTAKINETVADKGIKVIKINATTEMTFPTTNTLTTSEAGRNKISVGEPLEIIYTNRGKFLRVSRTGDLFAIKGNGNISSNNDNSSSTKENNMRHLTGNRNEVAGLMNTSNDQVQHQSETSEILQTENYSGHIDTTPIATNSSDNYRDKSQGEEVNGKHQQLTEKEKSVHSTMLNALFHQQPSASNQSTAISCTGSEGKHNEMGSAAVNVSSSAQMCCNCISAGHLHSVSGCHCTCHRQLPNSSFQRTSEGVTNNTSKSVNNHKTFTSTPTTTSTTAATHATNPYKLPFPSQSQLDDTPDLIVPPYPSIGSVTGASSPYQNPYNSFFLNGTPPIYPPELQSHNFFYDSNSLSFPTNTNSHNSSSKHCNNSNNNPLSNWYTSSLVPTTSVNSQNSSSISLPNNPLFLHSNIKLPGLVESPNPVTSSNTSKPSSFFKGLNFPDY